MHMQSHRCYTCAQSDNKHVTHKYRYICMYIYKYEYISMHEQIVEYFVVLINELDKNTYIYAYVCMSIYHP